MTKDRLRVPTRLKRILYLECGFKCSIWNCQEKIGLQRHHINGKPNDNRIKNLLLLCPNHHDMATRGLIDRKACIMIKESLQKSFPLHGDKMLEMIATSTRKAVREEFQKATIAWSKEQRGKK